MADPAAPDWADVNGCCRAIAAASNAVSALLERDPANAAATLAKGETTVAAIVAGQLLRSDPPDHAGLAAAAHTANAAADRALGLAVNYDSLTEARAVTLYNIVGIASHYMRECGIDPLAPFIEEQTDAH